MVKGISKNKKDLVLGISTFDVSNCYTFDSQQIAYAKSTFCSFQMGNVAFDGILNVEL